MAKEDKELDELMRLLEVYKGLVKFYTDILNKIIERVEKIRGGGKR